MWRKVKIARRFRLRSRATGVRAVVRIVTAGGPGGAISAALDTRVERCHCQAQAQPRARLPR